jgi:hypothetical protein
MKAECKILFGKVMVWSKWIPLWVLIDEKVNIA